MPGLRLERRAAKQLEGLIKTERRRMNTNTKMKRERRVFDGQREKGFCFLICQVLDKKATLQGENYKSVTTEYEMERKC